MTFVNIRGEPVSVKPVKTAGKRSGRVTPDEYHKGWVVLGFSPEKLAAARVDHDAAPVAAGREKAPFDEALYLRTATPEPVRSMSKGSKSFSTKVFVLEQAAEQCAEMLRRAGWKMVRPHAKTKGGQ